MVKPASKILTENRPIVDPNAEPTQVSNGRRAFRNQHEQSFAASADALSEIAQAKIRNWIHVVVVVLAAVATQFEESIDSVKVLATAVVGLPVGFILYYWAIFLNEKKPPYSWRLGQRITSMFSDMFFITWVLHFGGENFAGLYALYIWITVGYGIRYGVKYLSATLVLSVFCFATAAFYTPFWNTKSGLVAGLLFGLIIVPAYVGWLISQLQKAVAEKDLAYRAKSDFVAMMSHELRTPLHGIISTSDLLKGTASSPKQKEMIRIISTSSSSLLQLINRVLDISKFESNAISLQRLPMDLHAVVNDTANILWPQALKKGLGLQVYIDPEIHNALVGSPDQLQEVLINLCGNAVKFTETGQVSVRALYRSETDDKVDIRFEISDTGPGIPKHSLSSIFEPFVQSDSATTRKHGGTGLGTAFAKELVRLMGGDISVESTEGVGTKFTVDVALQKLEESTEVAPFFPFTVAAIGFDERTEALTAALSQFGTKVSLFETAFELPAFDGVNHNDPYPEAVFVNADRFADNLGGVVRTIKAMIPDRVFPIYACGNSDYRLSAIAAGYSAYLPGLGDSELVGRTLNMISALRHESSDHSGLPTRHTKGLRVLVAEDNNTNQRIAQMVLEGAGYHCTIVSNGDEALDALHEGGFDLAILDMHMPHRDGIEVAKIYNFSHFDPEERIPLIMMTADSRQEARDEARDNGIDAFVTKPITPTQLVDVIESIVAKNGIKDRVSLIHESSYDNDPTDNHDMESNSNTPGNSGSLNMATVNELLSLMDAHERVTFFEDFIADGTRYIESLVDCGNADKVPTAKDEMHAFAGACMAVGADELAGLARDIELSDTGAIAHNHRALHDEISTSFEHVTQVIRGLSTAS